MTAAAAIAVARGLYPLSAAVTDAILTAWWEQAAALAGDRLGARQTLAQAHLLGHYAERWAQAQAGAANGGSGVSAGTVTASSSSGMSITLGAWAGAGAYQPTTPTEADLLQTVGGRAFLTLIASRAAVRLPVAL